MNLNMLIDSGLVRSHEERRWLFEEPTQSRISPSILEYTKMNPSKLLPSRSADHDKSAVLVSLLARSFRPSQLTMTDRASSREGALGAPSPATFFFFFITLGLELSGAKNLRALNTGPPRNGNSMPMISQLTSVREGPSFGPLS